MKYKSLNEAFVSELSELKTSGSLVKARGSNQLEKVFVNFEISNPTDINVTVESRKFNQRYAIAEWLWYLSANSKVNNISKLASIWKDIQDSYGEVESNYGSYIFSLDKNFSRSQWSWVVNELLVDRDSRRATISINQPYHKEKNAKDYPCTQYIQFFVRDNRLHVGVSMRSNDIIFGLCNDIFTFCLFQQLMLNELNDRGLKLELGSYFHHAGSLHIYERHFKMMDNILNNLKEEYSSEKLLLKQGLTYKKLLSLRSEISSKELTKKEIFSHVDKAKGDLFDV
jgi:thymidylate synthase